jgi:hypothetical protein
MNQTSRAFQVVDGPTEEAQAQPKQPAINTVSVQMLGMALAALSQRALVALSSLFTLLTVGSTFWLWMSIPDPNTQQIISLTIYAAFVLAANLIVRRK